MTGLRGLAARRPFGVALVAALALLLVPWRTLLGPGVPSGRDLVPYFYPLKASLAEALRAGELPLVDRFRGGGLPLLAWPGVAAFDPGSLLFVLLPTAAAAKAWMLLRVLAGAAGFAVFLRVAGLAPLACAFGALAWGTGGVTVSSASFLGLSSAHAALPWLAAGLLHARERRTPRSVALLAVAAALLVVASVPEPLVSGALIAVVLLAGKGSGAALRERAGAAGLWAASALVGALLAAPALGAFLVTGLEGIRGAPGALTPAFASQGSLPPARLGDLLVDGAVADWSRVGRTEDVPSYPYFPSLTPGRAAWTLALLGLVAGRRARLRASALALLGVLLALGPATPLLGLLHRALPLTLSLRYPEKFAVLFAFGAAWLAALGAEALERELGARRAWPAFALLSALVLLDRDGAARRLLPTSPSAVVERSPEVLAGLPRAGRDASPTRLYVAAAWGLPPGAIAPDVSLAGSESARWAIPFSPGLWGVATVFERDYDISLPRPQVDWAVFLEESPAGSPHPARLARAAGAVAVVEAAPGRAGPVPSLRPLEGAVPPYRFVGRVVPVADPRARARRFLLEGAPVDAAFVAAAASVSPSPGRVLRVSDRPPGLELEVEAEGPGPAYLLVARPLAAARDARLDGRPVSVDDANLGFTGVAVPPGRHVVRLRPPADWMIIAAVTSLLGIALTAFLYRRDRPGAPAAG